VIHGTVHVVDHIRITTVSFRSVPAIFSITTGVHNISYNLCSLSKSTASLRVPHTKQHESNIRGEALIDMPDTSTDFQSELVCLSQSAPEVQVVGQEGSCHDHGLLVRCGTRGKRNKEVAAGSAARPARNAKD